jgi:hypothetical protein
VALPGDRSRVFEPGLAVTIEVNGPEEAFPSRVEEVRADYLVVGTPMHRREYVELAAGQRLLLSVNRRNNPYFFETVVVGAEWVEGRQHTLLRRPADNAGIALRETVRVPVTISDAQFWWETEEGKFGPTTPGHLVDLSAGGMQVVTKSWFQCPGRRGDGPRPGPTRSWRAAPRRQSAERLASKSRRTVSVSCGVRPQPCRKVVDEFGASDERRRV